MAPGKVHDAARSGPPPALARYPRCCAARTVAEACSGLVDDLAGSWELPSVYLLIDGRLRCMAASGYFQVVDGFTTDTGVIGRVVRTGSTVVVEDVRQVGEFIAAVPGICAEVCAPIMLSGRGVGAVSLEGKEELPSNARHVVTEAADVLAHVIAALGGLPPVPMAQRLARLAVEMTSESDVERMRQLTVDAAVQISGRSSAALILMAQDDRWEVCTSTGPLGGALSRWGDTELNLVAQWVEAGTSSHFPGVAPVPPEYEFVQRAGVRCVGVQPPVSGGIVLGMLVVADAEPAGHNPTVVAGIELLASIAATCLRNAALLGDLTDRATRDPLTGLRNSAEFHADLTEASITAIKSGKISSACMLIDVDHFKQVNDLQGHPAGDALLRELAGALSRQLGASDALYRIGGDEFAAVVGSADASTAIAVAGRLVAAAKEVGAPVSLGWTMIDAAPIHIRHRADAALYAAKHGGRGTHRPASP